MKKKILSFALVCIMCLSVSTISANAETKKFKSEYYGAVVATVKKLNSKCAYAITKCEKKAPVVRTTIEVVDNETGKRIKNGKRVSEKLNAYSTDAQLIVNKLPKTMAIYCGHEVKGKKATAIFTVEII